MIRPKDLMPLVLPLICLGAGCGRSSTHNAIGPQGVFKSAGLHETSRRPYQIDAPDEVIVTAPGIAELDGQHVKVNPNGLIFFPHLGEVHAAGLTIEELREQLVGLASTYYVKPQVRVEIIDNSKFYYVFGLGANRPGKMPYAGRITVVGALADAGFNQFSWPEQVRLSRPARDGNQNATVVIDFTKAWDYGDLTQNYLIEEGDIVFVPITPLAYASLAIQQLLAPLTGTAELVTAGPNALNAVRGRGSGGF